jgi:type VI secretion system protein ImpH
MAGDHRQTPADLAWLARLERAPYDFGFYTALRRFEAQHRQLPRLGYAPRPQGEPVRISQNASMAFASATLASFTPGAPSTPGAAGRPAKLSTNFFGLLGPNGPLPIHLTEHAYERIVRNRDRTFAAFLDVFHHRMALYFYRAWADAQPTVQYDRPEQDRFATYVGSLIGVGMPSLRNRDAMPDETKLHFAGHLGVQGRHASGLRSILSSFLRVPVELEQFVGEWVEVPADCRLRLRSDREAAALGQSAVLGRRIWDRRQSFGLTFGPMSWDAYRRLLPGGETLKRVEAVIKNYVGLTFRWNIRLVLRKEEVPRMELGREGRLGWSSWLGSSKRTTDARDLSLRSRDAA